MDATSLPPPNVSSLVASLQEAHDHTLNQSKVGVSCVVADPDPNFTRYVVHEVHR